MFLWCLYVCGVLCWQFIHILSLISIVFLLKLVRSFVLISFPGVIGPLWINFTYFPHVCNWIFNHVTWLDDFLNINFYVFMCVCVCVHFLKHFCVMVFNTYFGSLAFLFTYNNAQCSRNQQQTSEKVERHLSLLNILDPSLYQHTTKNFHLYRNYATRCPSPGYSFDACVCVLPAFGRFCRTVWT